MEIPPRKIFSRQAQQQESEEEYDKGSKNDSDDSKEEDEKIKQNLLRPTMERSSTPVPCDNTNSRIYAITTPSTPFPTKQRH